jgi:Flp pilus assembly protein TadG
MRVCVRLTESLLVYDSNALNPGIIMILAKKIRSLGIRSNESGSSLVEFALAGTILLLLIFGILDCSRAMYADHFVAYAAREATRYGMVRGSTWKAASCSSPTASNCATTTQAIKNFVTSIVPPGISASNLTVSTVWPGTTMAGATCATPDPGCLFKVTVNYSFTFNVPFMPPNTFALTSTSAAVITQ